MATVAGRFTLQEHRPDVLSGTPRAHAIDRWIFVFMAVWFIAIVLTGFIPDSLGKIAAVRTGEHLPFPAVLHVHAVLMGSFLLLLLGQTWLMATGRRELHMQLGVAGLVLACALVVVGFILVPTNYYLLWNAVHSGLPGAAEKFIGPLHVWENILLLQLRIGVLFPLFLAIGGRARSTDAGLHKRMMIIATAMALPAAIDRITWLPSMLPASPIAADFYTWIAVSPMLVWDLLRNRSVHRAYWISLAVYVPVAVFVNLAWDTSWWHSVARQIMGV